MVAGLQPASALAVDGDGEVAFEVPLPADHGLSAKLEADDDEFDLTIQKGTQQAYYFPSKGEVSADRISVRFGRLGEFVVDYTPFRTLATHDPGPRCEGEPRTRTEGYFEGILRFRGEGGYVHIEAARAKGTLLLSPPWTCRFGNAASSGARGRTGEEDDPKEATLGCPLAAVGSLSRR